MTAREANPELFEECGEIFDRFEPGAIEIEDLEPGEADKLMDMISLHREFEE